MAAALVTTTFTGCIEEIDPQNSTVTEQQAKDAPGAFTTSCRTSRAISADSSFMVETAITSSTSATPPSSSYAT